MKKKKKCQSTSHFLKAKIPRISNMKTKFIKYPLKIRHFVSDLRDFIDKNSILFKRLTKETLVNGRLMSGRILYDEDFKEKNYINCDWLIKIVRLEVMKVHFVRK